MSDEKKSASKSALPLQGVIGYSGGVRNGLLLHPDDEHIITPLGSTLVVKGLTKNIQHFLQKNGHDHPVSCVAISPSGRYLASGQETHMGFPAFVVVWDLETCEAIHKLELHKGKVQDLAFSPKETYLATLGGADDNRIAVWDLKTGQAACGAAANKDNEPSLTISFMKNAEDKIVTAGHYHVKLWDLNLKDRKLRFNACQLGPVKRIIQCLVVDAKDEFAYCGTTSGDVLKLSLIHNVFKLQGPAKQNFCQGIQTIILSKEGHLIVGSGDGDVAVLDKDNLTVIRKMRLPSGVTSLQLNAAGDHFFVGTKNCSIYLVRLDSFEHELRTTCHHGAINDIAFPTDYSQLFATCGHEDIRIWNSHTCTELLRIQVPGLTCLTVAFAVDGKSILSGWSDGKIRAFKPQSGKLMYLIHDAHANGGVTAISGTKDSKFIISGGVDGQVRVWSINAQSQRMVASMKEHKGAISSIKLNKDDTECISSSADGSCIVWSLERFVRISCLFAATQFKIAVYHPDQSQYLTTGTDRKITYWDAVDASPIRIMEASASAEVNALDIAPDGERFVAAGGDKVVKVYGYDEGFCFFRGVGHSGSITKVAISPDQQFVVSAGSEGAIFLWKLPELSEAMPAQQATGVAVAKSNINAEAEEAQASLAQFKQSAMNAIKA